MLGHGTERPGPSPSFMNEEQVASYLKDLRTNRVARPTGARPAPPSKVTGLKRVDSDGHPNAAAASQRPTVQSTASMPSMPVRPSSAFSHTRSESARSIRSPFAGRPLVRPPSALSSEATSSQEKPTLSRRSSVNYMENGARWMEKQEAQSLRQALQDMDLQDDQKIHSAAQDEAAELVWKHRSQGSAKGSDNAPYANPDAKRDYHSHLRKGSYTRSHSQATSHVDPGAHSESQTEEQKSNLANTENPSAKTRASIARAPSGKNYGDLAAAVKKDIDNARRRTSSGSKRVLSGEKKLYMHPNDRIWEDPEPQITPRKISTKSIMDDKPSLPASMSASIRKSPFVRRAQMQQDMLERSNSAPVIGHAKFDKVEIQRNTPSQSRKAMYTSNECLPESETPPQSKKNVEQPNDPIQVANVKEIRGEDIRAATSKRRSDRSVNLPQPTMVTDKPGRPIVSFEHKRKPKRIELEQVQSGLGPVNSIEPSKAPMTTGASRHQPLGQGKQSNPDHRRSEDLPKPPIPTIVLPDETETPIQKPPIPIINLPDEAELPSIVLPEEPFSHSQHQVNTPTISVTPTISNATNKDFSSASTSPKRPLPVPLRTGHMHHAVTSPLPRSTPHMTPTLHHSGTLCAHCALPIAGRILSAAGERFHPQCFVCHECHTNLELVAFYPEPEQQRSERLARIQARQEGKEIDHRPGWTKMDMHRLEVADGDSTLRFFCHLDFHELFSPRCKSCKTPIEGKVIVACGAEWHEGHFFCAQCGDPFDASMPFVEKDGYAWCVGCHTNRYSSKCRKCRKPVTDVVVKALGADWHSECFCCTECSGEFQDGRYFLRGDSQDPVCVRCEERRLKA